MKTQKSPKLFFRLFQLFLALRPIPSTSRSTAYKELESFSFDAEKVTQLVHKKSGARLVVVKNKEARSLAMAFRTPAYNNTGIFHAFEHSIFHGSRLHPSKHMFNTMLHSTVASLYTAYTNNNYTAYYFITRNAKDFDNLLSIYMDAVFFPKSAEEPRIIKRDGWRYEIDPETQDLTINGIVMNEMKGWLSSPDWGLFRNTTRFFLPDTPHAYEGGGDPEEIINLEFDQIVSAHKKYYHPQNSLIVLSGDVDVEKTLSEMDKNFLSHFEKDKNFKAPEIPLQKKINYPAMGEVSYPGTKESGNILVKGYVLGPLDPVEKDALRILLDAFLHETGSLKLRIANETLAGKVQLMTFNAEDNLISLAFHNIENLEIKNILQEEIDKVIRQGLDSQILKSVLNKYDFFIKNEKNQSHKAEKVFKTITLNWLYSDQNLKEKLNHSARFKKVLSLLSDENFIKNFFKRHFKENNQTSWLMMKPDPDYSKRFIESEKKRLKEALEIKPLDEYRKEDELYREWLNAEEPPEIKNAIPLLELSDLKEEEKPIPFQKYDKGPYEIIEYPQSSNGISKVQMFFDLRGVSEENLKNLSLLEDFLKRTNTKHYPFEKLAKKIDADTGSIGFKTTFHQSSKDPNNFKPFMRVELLFLNEKHEKSFSLLKEILLYSDFSPEDKIKSLLNKIRLETKNIDTRKSYNFSSRAAQKPFFPEMGGFLDETSGLPFVKYLLNSQIDTGELSSTLKHMLKNIFNQKRLKLAALTADESELETLRNSTEKLQQALPSQGSEKQTWLFANQQTPSAYATHSEVQYVTEAIPFEKQGLKYNGAFEVYSNYLMRNFLAPTLRDKMGAYLVWSVLKQNGLLNFVTQQDPNLERTFEVFSKALDFMKQEQKNLTPEKIKPDIIGRLRGFYRDYSIYHKANLMTNLYLEDSSWEKRMQFKREIMKTTPEDFKEITRGLEKAFRRSHKAVVGNAKKIKESGCFKSFADLP